MSSKTRNFSLTKESELLSKDKDIKNYLDENPFPRDEGDISDNDRMYYLLLNRLKNWLAREQSKKDGGSYWKRKFKENPTGLCHFCKKKLRKNDLIIFHHDVRDGRKPIPSHKKCHDNHHQKTEAGKKVHAAS